jgi:hypothetical protein
MRRRSPRPLWDRTYIYDAALDLPETERDIARLYLEQIELLTRKVDGLTLRLRDTARETVGARNGALHPAYQGRKSPIDHDKTLDRQRHKIENLFAKLKDWRRIATRYDRRAHAFCSAVCIATAVAFYFNQ